MRQLMPYRRGDVIAVPYDYSDLTGGTVRPADGVAAGISSQVAKVGPYDHLLADWAAAGLRYPSLVRGRLLTIEQRLIRRSIGHLSASDMASFEGKLAAFLLSDETIANYVVTRINLTDLPGRIVQALSEKAVRASMVLAGRTDPAIDLARLHALFPPQAK